MEGLFEEVVLELQGTADSAASCVRATLIGNKSEQGHLAAFLPGAAPG